MMVAPLRQPHENASDPHWIEREVYREVEHPELGRSFTYVTSKWVSSESPWQVGRRAPLSALRWRRSVVVWSACSAEANNAPKR